MPSPRSVKFGASCPHKLVVGKHPVLYTSCRICAPNHVRAYCLLIACFELSTSNSMRAHQDAEEDSSSWRSPSTDDSSVAERWPSELRPAHIQGMAGRLRQKKNTKHC